MGTHGPREKKEEGSQFKVKKNVEERLYGFQKKRNIRKRGKKG